MKRCIFVGPSLFGVHERPSEIEFLPPASRGDLIAAVHRGVEWIGLVDGYFGNRASVWHKEILFALSAGCHVWGAASLGALRAAECSRFGMKPVGTIAGRYVAGVLDDDADVALLHAPEEAGYAPLTEAAVDARATIEVLQHSGSISTDEAKYLRAAATRLHFSERTVDAMIGGCSLSAARQADMKALYAKHRVSLKQNDAVQLMNSMRGSPGRLTVATTWDLAMSPSLASLRADGS